MRITFTVMTELPKITKAAFHYREFVMKRGFAFRLRSA